MPTLDPLEDVCEYLDKEGGQYVLLALFKGDNNNYKAYNWWAYDDEDGKRMLSKSLSEIQKSILQKRK